MRTLGDFAQRWLEMPDHRRLALCGSEENVERVDSLARAVIDDPSLAADVLADRRDRMRKVVARLRRAESRVLALRVERNLLMIEEAVAGERQQRIAESAGVTAMIVAIAIGTVERPRRAS